MRRRRRSRHLGGMKPDTVIGLSMLVGGVGLAYILWKKNTPSSEDIRLALEAQNKKTGVAGFGGCGCAK
jgi:hypothetical protein